MNMKTIDGCQLPYRSIFVFILGVMIVLGNPARLGAQDLAYIPDGSPVYSLLERARAGGYLVYLPQIRPYTRKDAIRLALEANASGAPVDLVTDLDAALDWTPIGLNLRSDWNDGDSIAVLNRPQVGIDWNLAKPGDLEIRGDWIMDVGLGFGDSLYLGVQQDFSLSYLSWMERPFPEFEFPATMDMNMYTFFLSSDSQGFNHDMVHIPGESDVSIQGATTMQFSIGLPFGAVQIGRQALDWGPSDSANLVLSGTAKPYEYLGYAFDIGGKGTFMWMTGVLQPFGFSRDYDYKLVTAHRLEYQVLPWLLFAIHESIVYGYRFELAYMNPLALYYIAEVNKGDQDNKLGGIDLVVHVPDTKLYLSLLADDWDFGELFSFTYFHNLWAMILGAKNYSVPGLTLGAEYVHLSHWMYTHWTDNNYTNWDTHLGHPLQPNSHLFSVNAEYGILEGLEAGIDVRLGQKGRGDIDTPADWAAEATLYGVPLGELFYRFLDKGVLDYPIETFWDASLSISYTPKKIRINFMGSYTLARTINEDNLSGADGWDHFLSFKVSF